MPLVAILNTTFFRFGSLEKATASTAGLTFGHCLSTLIPQSTMNTFQIIFSPTSAAELGKMPKELQLQILGEFRGLPQQVRGAALDAFGKLERGGRILHRFRVGDYRVYFERHELGVLVHRILSRHTVKDFLFRSGLKTGEDEALQENPKFWELIESAKTSAKT
jgi:mRNA-degrading endonuclease RelE of RelBE toxin-antitoxin system